MPKWTEHQASVIEHKNKNLLVSAAAGSGKTAVMIEHIYTQIVKHNATIDRMLVATYTNAAAASMKEKLINKLDSAYEENPDDTRLLKQKQMVDRSDISTLHSYCIKTLRKYYFYTPLSPDFRIFQGTQLKMLSNSALEQIIEEAAKKYNDGMFPEYDAILKQFAGAKNDRLLEELIYKLHSALSPLPHPDEFKEHILNLYSDPNGSLWYDFILSYCKDMLKNACELCEKIKTKYLYTDIGEKCSVYIDKIITLLENGYTKNSLDEILTEISITFPSIRGIDTSLNKKPLADNINVVKEIRENVKDLCASVKNRNLTFLYPAINGLFKLHSDYAQRLEELMLNEGGTDFDSVLRYMLQLIEENPDILEDIRNNTDYIYIDEYQDINALQNYIIELISKGDNMFFVGDIKQSIYGFNYARPDLFKDKMHLYQENNDGRRINLMNNFRSYPEILEGVNFIFENIMFKEDISEIIYDSDAALYPSPDKEFLQHRDCIYNNGTPEIANEILYIDTENYSEAEAIAIRIKELLNTEIIDPKTNTKRPVQYGDIAILARQKKYASLLESVFKAHSIPLSAQKNDEQDNSDSVSAIIALLNLLILRRSDIDLITVLLSNIGMFTPTELALIRAENQNSSFYDAFMEYDKKPSIKKKKDDFLELLNKLEVIQKSMALADFIEYIYNETGYIYHTAFLSDNSSEIKSYNNLLAAARSYSEFADGTLRGFLNYYENLSSYTEEVPFALDENDNSVHFMTIHKSKGLEFPIVFVMSMNAGKGGGNKSYLFNESLGFGFNYKSIDQHGKRSNENSIAKTAISILQNKLEAAEDMRVFYVALTRAKNKLILSCPILKKKLSSFNIIPHQANLRIYSSYSQLVLPLIFNHIDGAPLREYINDVDYYVDEEQYIFDKSKWLIRIFEENCQAEFFEIETSTEEVQAFDKKSYLEKVNEAFLWKYEYALATTARTKRSPSKSQIRSKIPLRRPKFEDKEFKGAQKGTVVHFFMEHVSFNSNLSAKEQADDMLKTGILTQKEYDALPFKNLERFMASPFVQRMRNSDRICRERSFCQIVPFEDTGDEALVQGIIDCYFFEDDDIILLDYKTDIIKDDLDEHILHHTPQLKMYKYALEQLYPGKKVYPYIHFFDVDKTVEIK